jgi:hypothetical protein
MVEFTGEFLADKWLFVPLVILTAFIEKPKLEFAISNLHTPPQKIKQHTDHQLPWEFKNL